LIKRTKDRADIKRLDILGQDLMIGDSEAPTLDDKALTGYQGNRVRFVAYSI
jgi:hypothetical protein